MLCHVDYPHPPSMRPMERRPHSTACCCSAHARWLTNAAPRPAAWNGLQSALARPLPHECAVHGAEVLKQLTVHHAFGVKVGQRPGNLRSLCRQTRDDFELLPTNPQTHIHASAHVLMPAAQQAIRCTGRASGSRAMLRTPPATPIPCPGVPACASALHHIHPHAIALRAQPRTVTTMKSNRGSLFSCLNLPRSMALRSGPRVHRSCNGERYKGRADGRM